VPIRNAIWTVSENPQSLVEARLPSERALEDMIVAAPRILSDEWMLIGRQERTGASGIIDLLAIAPDAALILIELKRDRTPREVVAQAIDYACWIENLETDEIAAITTASCQAAISQPIFRLALVSPSMRISSTKITRL
jgi:RecB family endonuclease NucS